MRIGHASISENNNSGRDGRAQAGDQTKKEVCIREYYRKDWQTILRCKDASKRNVMALACEAICNNDKVGYDQLQRNSLNTILKQVNYDFNKIDYLCETDCSAFMTVCCQCAKINIPYSNGNAPTTSTMVKVFEKTGMFDVIAFNTETEKTLLRGDIIVGKPATHTIMVLDDNVVKAEVPLHIQKRRTLKKGMKGSDVLYMQQILKKMGYDLGKCGCDSDFGQATEKALKEMQSEKGLLVDGICGQKSWLMLEQYA